MACASLSDILQGGFRAARVVLSLSFAAWVRVRCRCLGTRILLPHFAGVTVSSSPFVSSTLVTGASLSWSSHTWMPLLPRSHRELHMQHGCRLGGSCFGHALLQQGQVDCGRSSISFRTRCLHLLHTDPGDCMSIWNSSMVVTASSVQWPRQVSEACSRSSCLCSAVRVGSGLRVEGTRCW
jgi:hypothetical protein